MILYGGIVFVVIIVLFVLSLTKTEHFKIQESVPKVIWTYWHDPKTMPRVVRECVRSWERWCPDHDVRVLGPRDFESDETFRRLREQNRSQARVSDYVRLAVLKRYGGIWMDASTYLTTSLDWLLERSPGKDLVGFYHWSTHKGHTNPIVESFFLATPKGSPFISDWHDEFVKSQLQYASDEKYIEHVQKETQTDIQGLGSKLPYLIVYLCAAVVQQRGARYDMILLDAMGPQGPYKYMNKHRWDVPKSVEHLRTDPDVQTPIVKFHNGVRDYLEKTYRG
jgi:hypothetical protein